MVIWETSCTNLNAQNTKLQISIFAMGTFARGFPALVESLFSKTDSLYSYLAKLPSVLSVYLYV
jgi:hypothetical protein